MHNANKTESNKNGKKPKMITRVCVQNGSEYQLHLKKQRNVGGLFDFESCGSRFSNKKEKMIHIMYKE